MTLTTSISSPGPVAKVFILIWGSLFIGIPTTIAVVLLHSSYQQLQPYLWSVTTCHIDSVEIQPVDTHYQPVVSYSYDADGNHLTGEQFAIGSTTQNFNSYSAAQKKLGGISAGQNVECFVNPNSPIEVVLRRSFPWQVFIVLFPLAFIAVGIAVIYTVFRAAKEKNEPLSKPLTQQTKYSPFLGILGRIGAFVFFGIFFSVGAAAAYFLYIAPMLKKSAASHWVETTCTVELSNVRTISGDDTTSYAPNILYSHNVAGKLFRASQYSLAGKEQGSASWATDIVNFHPVGSTTQCWFDPKDPSDAALDLSGVPNIIPLLVGGLFALIGFIGMLSTLRWKTPATASANRLPGQSSATPRSAFGISLSDERKELFTFHSGSSRRGTIIALILISLFWNGIVSVFVYQLINGFSAFSISTIFLGLFLTPFVGVGLAIVAATFKSILALSNPNVEIKIQKPIISGEDLSLEWQLVGNVSRIKSLRITLEGQEEIRYQRGTDTIHDKRLFEVIEITKIDGRQIGSHPSSVRVSVPALSAPSFATANNYIRWYVRIHGEIHRWPDIADEFQIPMVGGNALR